jgi:hypothetical protein
VNSRAKKHQLVTRLPRLGAFVVAVCALAWSSPAITASCPERPACHGCGCKGGPGYRGPDGRCVGFRELDNVCGSPATVRCTFENAPGTGLIGNAPSAARMGVQAPESINGQGSASCHIRFVKGRPWTLPVKAAP